MGLGDLFKRLSKGGSEPEKKPEKAPRTKGGHVMPPMPKYLKQDKFIRSEGLGPGAATAGASEAPEMPDAMADAGSFKRPGKWLKARLGGTTDSQAIENIEKTKIALKKSGGLNDAEIQTFLDGLLDEAPATGAEAPAAKSGPPSKLT